MNLRLQKFIQHNLESVMAALVQLLVTLKSLPPAYNRRRRGGGLSHAPGDRMAC